MSGFSERAFRRQIAGDRRGSVRGLWRDLMERRRVGQYDQIRITESNKLPNTTIVGTGSKRCTLRLNMAAALPKAICQWCACK
jgi:hypothetical protein